MPDPGHGGDGLVGVGQIRSVVVVVFPGLALPPQQQAVGTAFGQAGEHERSPMAEPIVESAGEVVFHHRSIRQHWERFTSNGDLRQQRLFGEQRPVAVGRTHVGD